MRVASVKDVAADFAGFLKESEQGPIVVTRDGKPVAVLLSTGNQEDLERLLLGHSANLQTILEAARKRFRAGGGIPHETFWNEVEAETAGKSEKPSSTRKKRASQR
jgi:prevent-host-death family protein